jgi:hypothetical protein
MQRSGAPLRLPSCWVPVPRKKLRLKKRLLPRKKWRRLLTPLPLPAMPLLLPAMPPLLPVMPLPLPVMPLLPPAMLLLLLKKPRRRSNR